MLITPKDLEENNGPKLKGSYLKELYELQEGTETSKHWPIGGFYHNKMSKWEEYIKEKHEGQTHHDGSPYYEHLERVRAKAIVIAQQFYKHSPDKMEASDLIGKVALGHDVIEDQGATEESIKYALKDYSYAPSVSYCINILSRKNNETYFDFIRRVIYYHDVKTNAGALAQEYCLIVKLSDLYDNTRNLKEGALKDNYRFATQKIGSALIALNPLATEIQRTILDIIEPTN